MMSYSNKLHNSSFQSNGGVNDGGSSGDDGDDGLAGDGQWPGMTARICAFSVTWVAMWRRRRPLRRNCAGLHVRWLRWALGVVWGTGPILPIVPSLLAPLP